MKSDAPDAAGTAPARDERTETRPARREPEPLAAVIERVVARMVEKRGA